MSLQGFHHVAYRCRDAKQTVDFYRQHLDMDFMLAIAEDTVPSTGEENPYMHVFMDAGNGNVLAFFELPESPAMGRDENTPEWVQHIAIKVSDKEELIEYKRRLESSGIEVLGLVDHGIFDSIYFFDPNGHRIELAANKGTAKQLKHLKEVADPMLDEWAQTRRAPRHAAWLHESS